MITIGKTAIGKGSPPYIIAELSANHGGSIERAKTAILEAKKIGANAVKIQSYTPDTMTINCNLGDFLITEGLWSGKNLFDLYSEAFTPFEWHPELFDFAKKNEITLFSTPFDESAVDLLESLEAPAYKIASFELTDLPLIKYVAEKNKPLLISTGMGSLQEIDEVVSVVKETGNKQLILLHCVSAYPASTGESQLNNLHTLKKTFKLDVGLSDHTNTNLASIMSIALGAIVIEKHFRLDTEECGPDSSFSLLPKEFALLVKECNEAWRALGEENFCRSNSEKKNLQFRRSLYFVRDLKKGEVITLNDIRKIRPGFGSAPKFFNAVIGSKVDKDVKRGEPVLWDCICQG